MKLAIEESLYELSGIYCIRNTVNDARYIGQTSEGFYKRWIRHSSMLKANKHFNKHLQNAYNKYGDDAFEMYVVETCENLEELPILEEKYISEYRSMYECYNFLSGGPTMCGENNPFFGKKHTKETSAKLSEANKKRGLIGEKCYFYGKDHSGEKNGFYGKHHTEESRKIMSEKKKELLKDPTKNPFYGKTHTEETIERIRKKTMESEHRKVICIETNIVYRSIAEASRQTGALAKSISAVCAGHRKKAGNLHWKYA